MLRNSITLPTTEVHESLRSFDTFPLEYTMHGTGQPAIERRVPFRSIMAFVISGILMTGCATTDVIGQPTTGALPVSPLPTRTEPNANIEGIFGQDILNAPVESNATTTAQHITAVRAAMATLQNGSRACVRAVPSLRLRNPLTKRLISESVQDRRIVIFHGMLKPEDYAEWNKQLQAETRTDNIYQLGYVDFLNHLQFVQEVVVPLDWVVPAAANEQNLNAGDECEGSFDSYPAQ